MHRIDTPTAQKDKFGAGKNGFTAGNPQTGTPSTDLDNDYFDMLQEELAGVVEATGVNLDKSKHNQLLTALKALLLSRAHPFADIKADGPAAIAEALSNLGLGEAAKRDVGTGANQIPDMTLFAKLHSGNGYQKLPGGLIIQWGSITGTIGQLSGVYPIAFPNAVFQVSVTLADKTAGISGGITLYAGNSTFGSKTSLTVSPTGSDGQGITAARYIVIGN